jgi:hypothetical protein
LTIKFAHRKLGSAHTDFFLTPSFLLKFQKKTSGNLPIRLSKSICRLKEIQTKQEI